MRVAAPVLATVTVLLLAGCASATAGGAGATGGGAVHGRVLRVVAAENFWGSLAAQIGGSRVQVTSIIANPNTDPHDYEPTARDARAFSRADYVIENGAGYDPWAAQLRSATGGRQPLLRVADLAGAKPGDNPHLWYDPSTVDQVVARITRDLAALDGDAGGSIRARGQLFARVGLAGYHQLIATIRAQYAGTPVGASESIFAPLAGALGLALRTPSGFLQAISEGSDVSAADKSVADRQIGAHQIRIYAENTQNETPQIALQVQACRAGGIPIATFTETLTPAGASFQQWQESQLQALRAALAKGTGR
ncbi:MAG TPA: zinc ABC transporter substrate-binding protein [Mycobacteriales bacterium]|nr:zinc ABC transporter substrate-binding protein [Mycobacteriales bacterium]